MPSGAHERPDNTAQTTPPDVQPPPDQLQALRDSIDGVDAALVQLLGERFECTRKVGELKVGHKLPTVEPMREADQIAQLRRLAARAGLDPSFTEGLFRLILREVARQHATPVPLGPS